MSRRSVEGTPLVLAVGLVLADSSVVTLALPEVLRELDATVGGVAWVLIAFNLALALAALPAARLALRVPRGAFVWGVLGFAAASLGCAASGSLELLVAFRAGQGLAGAFVVASALTLLRSGPAADSAVARWGIAGVLGAAIGPAAGGVLTEAFSWEAMFALQAPVALLALAGLHGAGAPSGASPALQRPALAPLAALTLLSAALAAALFLLVLLVIEGWRTSPGAAAAVVSVMPVATVVTGRLLRRHSGDAFAAGGVVLVAGGLAGLALLPSADPAWTLGPQIALGAGLGIALTALIGGTVGAAKDPAGPAAWTITARHVGIVAGLLLLTPIFTHDLDSARGPAERAGVAALLDSPLALDPKVDLARALSEQVEDADERLPELEPAFDRVRGTPAEQPARAKLRERLDDELDRAGTDAFGTSFLVAALLALLALIPLGLSANARRRARAAVSARGEPRSNGSSLVSGKPLPVAIGASATLAGVLLAVLVLAGGGDFAPRAVADACADRPERITRSLDSEQRRALAILDGAACELDTSREALLVRLLRDRDGLIADDRAKGALKAGVDRAARDKLLGGVEATLLKGAIDLAGPERVLGLLGV